MKPLNSYISSSVKFALFIRKFSQANILFRAGMLGFILIPILLAGSLGVSFAVEKAEYTIGLIPQGPALEMHIKWTPLIKRLSSESGLKIKIKVFDQVSEFEEFLRAGNMDFVYLNSVQAVMAWETQKYTPLVRSKISFKGAIFVKKDSPVKSLKDLEGEKVALVSQRSLCGTVIKSALEKNEELNNYELILSGTASNVYKSVLLGKTIAGGTLDVALNEQSEEVVNSLRILYETAPMAPHPIAAHPRVPKRVRQIIIDTMMKISEDNEGKVLLKKIRMPAPLVKANYERDYRWLEKYSTY